jgi:hypothetical protein
MRQIYVSEAQFEALFTRMFDRIALDDRDGMDDRSLYRHISVRKNLRQRRPPT